jgi:CRISPR/Cas system CMR-associated protein Cmr1 (group 7 of RAMP superfamily)
VLDRIEMAIETVTPTFLHVEPEGEARWRAAPFRGLARWWFRAIAGAACAARGVEVSVATTRPREHRDVNSIDCYR